MNTEWSEKIIKELQNIRGVLIWMAVSLFAIYICAVIYLLKRF